MFYSIVNTFLPMLIMPHGRIMYTLHIVFEFLIYFNFQTFKNEESYIARKVLYTLIMIEFILTIIDCVIYGLSDAPLE